jgi:hypothetical protein
MTHFPARMQNTNVSFWEHNKNCRSSQVWMFAFVTETLEVVP